MLLSIKFEHKLNFFLSQRFFVYTSILHFIQCYINSIYIMNVPITIFTYKSGLNKIYDYHSTIFFKPQILNTFSAQKVYINVTNFKIY